MKENKALQKSDFERIAQRVALITVGANLLLFLFKLAAGLLASSDAMISDAIHSASDVFSTFVVMIGIRLSAKKADKEHPYGHERLECVAALLLSVVLFATGLGIGLNALQSITGESELQAPGALALIAALISILCKEWMYHYTKHHAKKINSSALMADAWHHRSDALSSVGALIGIGGAMLGVPVMDPIACLVIFFFIAKAAFDIFKDAMNKMVDRACDEQTEQRLCERVMAHEGVLGIDLLRTRMFGNRIYVEIEIRADAALSLQQAHGIAERVHRDVEKNFEGVKHVTVHVNPEGK